MNVIITTVDQYGTQTESTITCDGEAEAVRVWHGFAADLREIGFVWSSEEAAFTKGSEWVYLNVEGV